MRTKLIRSAGPHLKMFFFGMLLIFGVWGTHSFGQSTSGAPDTVLAATVTSSSTQMLAAGRRSYLSIDNESSSASIACAFGAAAALNTAGSFTLGAGVTRTWQPDPSQPYALTPTIGQAINCISSAGPSPATIEYHS